MPKFVLREPIEAVDGDHPEVTPMGVRSSFCHDYREVEGG